jgi:hypothetical protein
LRSLAAVSSGYADTWEGEASAEPLRLVSRQSAEENGKQETRNRKREMRNAQPQETPLTGFLLPVAGLLFFIFFILARNEVGRLNLSLSSRVQRM